MWLIEAIWPISVGEYLLICYLLIVMHWCIFHYGYIKYSYVLVTTNKKLLLQKLTEHRFPTRTTPSPIIVLRTFERVLNHKVLYLSTILLWSVVLNMSILGLLRSILVYVMDIHRYSNLLLYILLRPCHNERICYYSITWQSIGFQFEQPQNLFEGILNHEILSNILLWPVLPNMPILGVTPKRLN